MKNKTYKLYNPMKSNNTIKSITVVFGFAIFALLIIAIFNLVI